MIRARLLLLILLLASTGGGAATPEDGSVTFLSSAERIFLQAGADAAWRNLRTAQDLLALGDGITAAFAAAIGHETGAPVRAPPTASWRAPPLHGSLPPALRMTLTATITAFQQLEAGVVAGAPSDAVAVARGRLLATLPPLWEALAESGPVPAPPILHPPHLAIRLGLSDDVYEEDYALIIDAGGNDEYRNNAGGASFLGDPCALGRTPRAAAVVDLAGDDLYASPRACGGNGGAAFGGAGLLFDAAGDDHYLGQGRGANGGGYYGGLGLLLDLGGDDRYETGDFAGNGGGWVGEGMLLDAAGDDAYLAGGRGVNGGASLGRGFLFDGGGNDTYLGRGDGVNGGAYTGSAFLLDAAGDDVYEATSFGVNGGGFDGAGFLLDAGGNDTYRAGSFATNGGGARLGVLVDLAGDDLYEARGNGTNGGGFAGGAGFLLDGGGDDRYVAGAAGVNGGAEAGAFGFCSSEPCEEEPLAHVPSQGLLLDAAGHDVYQDADAAAPGSGVDRTVLPKGDAGAQIDLGADVLPFLSSLERPNHAVPLRAQEPEIPRDPPPRGVRPRGAGPRPRPPGAFQPGAA